LSEALWGSPSLAHEPFKVRRDQLLLGQLGLLLYAAAFWLITAAFVRWYEEPALIRRFGADYEAYRRAVPAWWPRLRPWKPGERDEPGAR
jgi:protein-S-isoprenylcysteine O-methyltransferase Ste14